MSKHFETRSPVAVALEKLSPNATRLLDEVLDWNDRRDFDIELYLAGGAQVPHAYKALIVLLVDLLQFEANEADRQSKLAEELENELVDRDNDAIDKLTLDGDE